MAFKMNGFPYSGKSPMKHGKYEDFEDGINGHTPDTMSAKHEDWHLKQSGESPNKQKEESELVLVRATDIVDPKTGVSHPTENMAGTGEDGHIPVKKNPDGTYFVETKDGDKVTISPTDESVVPRSLVKDVPLGRELQKVIKEYNISRGKK